jgi:hypothetical protein
VEDASEAEESKGLEKLVLLTLDRARNSEIDEERVPK